MKPYFIGESCLCWSLGTTINPATSFRVLRLYKAAKALFAGGGFGVLDVVPSYNALAVYFEPVTADAGRIQEAVQDLLARDARACEKGGVPAVEGDEVTLPVRYDGPDIERVVAHSGLSRAEVVNLHAAGSYTVAMIGFLPHFPYLMGLDKRLSTPRLQNPRPRVPAGSVAIGGSQTGVYPRESPGGWNIIGTTDPQRLIPLKPGDRVHFEKL